MAHGRPVRRGPRQGLRGRAGLDQRLLGFPLSFEPTDTEDVWELAEHRSLYIEQRPGHAGMHTIIVDDFDALLTPDRRPRLEPTEPETYSNGVRKAIYRDPDGNEIGFGDVPG
jgi:hypothetical protein